MKNVLQKIANAKELIKAEKLKKDGENEYSNYSYFTPGYVESLVHKCCQDLKLSTKFDLKRNELGITGYLTVYDLETEENLVYEMASDIPQLKATNIVQQLGGSMTYTERYLKMSAFGIVDNSLDPDANDNRPTNNVSKSQSNGKEAKQVTTPASKPFLNPKTPEFTKALEDFKLGTTTLEQLEQVYIIAKSTKALFVK